MNKILLLVGVLLVLVLPHQSKAQVALGLRLGEPSGLNARFGLGKQHALDVTLGGGYRWSSAWGYNLMANYLWIRPTGTSGLTWYYGIGGVVRTGYWFRRNPNDFDGAYTAFGANIPVGIDYKVSGSAFHVFGELNPGIMIGEYWTPVYLGGGLGVRIDLK